MMFTGLVQSTGTVAAVDRSSAGAGLEIATALAERLERGDSVAVSGVCVTATQVAGDRFRADLMMETLRRSSLAAVDRGDRLNLELPLRAGDRVGGHFVQGHVDGMGSVESVTAEGFARRVAIRADMGICRYVAHKGSIAVDGVSLTALDPSDEGFAVSLIPETLERTTLGELLPGRTVNLEVDLLAKYVERLAGGALDGAGSVDVPAGGRA
jgi:riboflavin synthase